MVREEMISEISMRRDIPLEDVSEVLEERDAILAEECAKKQKKKKMCALTMALVFIAGMIAALFVLDKKETISLDELEDMVKGNVKKYTDKAMDKIDATMKMYR